jgi:hypothetical protein
MGIGAFNLVRAEAYRKAGTHARIPMRPDDDMKLGKIVKEAGGRQHLLRGIGAVSVDWYPSLRKLATGLEKNAFAGVEYRLEVLMAGTAVVLLVMLWPVVALFLTSGWALALNAAAVALTLVLYADSARAFYGLPAWHALAYPVSALVLLFILWRAALLTLRRGGISWRDTHYPLSDLRANRV